MSKNYTEFISQAVTDDARLASWLYLLGVTPEQFETVFHRPEHNTIDRQVPAYHRYAAHLRKVLAHLTDDNVCAFIKLPKEPQDNAIYGRLFRKSDGAQLNISYNGVTGINVSSGDRALMGYAPPVNICPELSGNFSAIDKIQRDILLSYAKKNAAADTTGMERVTDGALDETRLDFLASICYQYLTRKLPMRDIRGILSASGWTDEEIDNWTSKTPDAEDDIVDDLIQDALDLIPSHPWDFPASHHDLNIIRENPDFRSHLKQLVHDDSQQRHTQKEDAEYVWAAYQKWQNP